MNETIFRRWDTPPGTRARTIRPARLLPGAALLPTAAAAAPISLTDTRVALLWPAILGAALLLACAVALALWLRLRREIAEGAQRTAALRHDNSEIHHQLQTYGSELASRERQLAGARESLELQRQEKSDLLAIIGHRLRQPLDTLHSTLKRLERSGDAESAQWVEMAQHQLQRATRSLEEVQRLGSLETVELKLPAELPAAESASLSILLVENDAQESLRGALEARGHRVQRANNGIDGATAALQKHFDLVLIDSHLPLMDGVEATQKIRRGNRRELPIFALLSEPRAGDKERYRNRGLTGVLARPVSDHQLQRLLNWALGRASAAAGERPARPTRMLNTSTLCQQRDTLGHLSFAELLSDCIATLPKRTIALTSALTGRHWPDAGQQARDLATTAEQFGLEAAAARLRAMAARLAIDSEREHCRHQRTELLNLMRASIQQLKAWREQNVHTERALK